MAASKPNLKCTAFNVLVLTISLTALPHVDSLSYPSLPRPWGSTFPLGPPLMEGNILNRVPRSLLPWDLANLPKLGSSEAGLGNERLGLKASHQHFAATPLRLEPSFSIPRETVS